MTTEPQTTLSLSLSSDLGRAQLTARAGLEVDLRRLAVGFQTSKQVAAATIEVELDELLTNLAELQKWPYVEAGDVVWDDNLKSLVVDSVNDARTVETELSSGESVPEATFEAISSLLGEQWRGDLTAFQCRDVAKLLKLRHGANFSVPGAGKTRVGLAVFQAMRSKNEVERLLIVGPKSTYEAWLSENDECLSPALSMSVFDGSIPEETEALVVNYERLPSLVGLLSRWVSERPTMLILDEAHRMKLGAEGAYGAACLALGPRSRRRLILTGTPAPNGVRDLENLFGFVWPGAGRQSVVQAVGGGDLVDASRALKPLFTRTTKGELGLPPVSISLATVALPTLHAEIYEALLGQFSTRASGQEGDFQALGRVVMYMLMAATSPALLAVGGTRHESLAFQVPPLKVPQGSTLYKLMEDLPTYEMSPKYREVVSIVNRNAAVGRKTLVWSTFVRSLTTLQQLLSQHNPAVVHGGTLDRDAEIGRFRNNSECMVLLSNPATLGEGISLHQDCHDAIYVDRDFAAGRFLQSLDRIHRLGLPPGTETRITVLASEGTIDEVVALRLGAKLAFMGGILDDPAVQALSDLAPELPSAGDIDSQDIQAVLGHLHERSA